jgi:hypothetical protein
MDVVMPGLVPGIHVLAVSPQRKTWMAGSRPALTKESVTTAVQLPCFPSPIRGGKEAP